MAELGAKELAIVRGAPLFQRLSERTLATMLAGSSPRQASRGATLFLQDEPADRFYLVLDGWVKLYRITPGGVESVINVVAPGETRADDVRSAWLEERRAAFLEAITALDLPVETGIDKGSVVLKTVDTTTPAGRFFFHVMASLAQMERELIAERTRAGLQAAKKRGRIGGRKRLMTPGKVDSARRLLDSGMAPREVAQNLGVSIPTLYRWVPASSL